MLDVASDSWETLPEMAEARQEAWVVAHEDRLLVIGGLTCGWRQQELSSCEQLKIGADEW